MGFLILCSYAVIISRYCEASELLKSTHAEGAKASVYCFQTRRRQIAEIGQLYSFS